MSPTLQRGCTSFHSTRVCLATAASPVLPSQGCASPILPQSHTHAPTSKGLVDKTNSRNETVLHGHSSGWTRTKGRQSKQHLASLAWPPGITSRLHGCNIYLYISLSLSRHHHGIEEGSSTNVNPVCLQRTPRRPTSGEDVCFLGTGGPVLRLVAGVAAPNSLMDSSAIAKML